MKRFKDKAGKEWEIDITVATMKRVRAVLNIDLFKIIDDDFALMKQLMNDPILLVDTLYVICEKQAIESNVTDEQFGEGLVGDSLLGAMDAFLEVLTDFFPERRGREALKKVLATGKAVYEIVSVKQMGELEGLDVEKLAKELEATLKSSSTDSPELSESTPTP